MSGGGGERERERERDTIKNNLKKKYRPATLIRIYKHLIFNW